MSIYIIQWLISESGEFVSQDFWQNELYLILLNIFFFNFWRYRPGVFLTCSAWTHDRGIQRVLLFNILLYFSTIIKYDFIDWNVRYLMVVYYDKQNMFITQRTGEHRNEMSIVDINACFVDLICFRYSLFTSNIKPEMPKLIWSNYYPIESATFWNLKFKTHVFINCN